MGIRTDDEPDAVETASEVNNRGTTNRGISINKFNYSTLGKSMSISVLFASDSSNIKGA